MDGGAIAQWAAVTVLACGQIYIFLRNSKTQLRNQADFQVNMVNKVEGIEKRLDDPKSGLSAIKDSVDEQKLNCARISTALSSRMNGVEDDITRIEREGKR